MGEGLKRARTAARATRVKEPPKRLERDYQYFTLVFKGDIGKLEKNPLGTDTPWGRPVAAGRGDAFEEMDELRALLDAEDL